MNAKPVALPLELAWQELAGYRWAQCEESPSCKDDYVNSWRRESLVYNAKTRYSDA